MTFDLKIDMHMDIDLDPSLDLTKSKLMAANPTMIKDSFALFEESYNKHERIKDLPIEDVYWSIGQIRNGPDPNTDNIRFMEVMSVTFNATNEPLYTSIALADRVSFENQALRLFYHACLHPKKKQPRRPHSLLIRSPFITKEMVLKVTQLGVIPLNSQNHTEDLHNEKIPKSIDFRMCYKCALRGSENMFHSCVCCDAVLYCDEECQLKSWQDDHNIWCKKLKQYMEIESQMANLPFEFIKYTTNRNFTLKKLGSLLQKNDVYDKGLWRRECQNTDKFFIPFGELDSSEKPYALPLEGAVLEIPPTEPPAFENPLSDWSDYYNFRGFWFDSIICGLLHYPLTLYWIITNNLQNDYPSTFENIKLTQSINVHLIGAEKEAEMFLPFLELARLLKPFELHLHLFGDELSEKVHNKVYKQGNLTFQVHAGLYHASNLNNLPQPHFAIGFNAGLSAYVGFMETIHILLKQAIPFYCTDYCRYSIAHTKKTLKVTKISSLSKPVINPFRSPFRIVSPELNLPQYSNGFVFHIKAFDVKTLDS